MSIAPTAHHTALPHRVLGKTGVPVSIFGLGGEGILRTENRLAQALPVIHAALDEGVTYVDTAPAYAHSRDYLGAGLGARRDKLFLASKTHARDAAGTRRLLEDSLRRLRTTHVDLLQLHDLRTLEDLDGIFAPDGALQEALRAQRAGLVRFLGITGHQDPAVLLEAMRRHPFDTVLTVVNPAEDVGLSFMRHVIPKARAQGMGVIAMKVLARGTILGRPHIPDAQAALHYAWSQDVDVAIVGCTTAAEVHANARAARAFTPLDLATLRLMEGAVAQDARNINAFKTHRPTPASLQG